MMDHVIFQYKITATPVICRDFPGRCKNNISTATILPTTVFMHQFSQSLLIGLRPVSCDNYDKTGMI